MRENLKVSQVPEQARLQKNKTDAVEERRKLYGPTPAQRVTLSLEVARMRTKNVPQQQDTLSVSGGKIWTEVAGKRKASTDVGGLVASQKRNPVATERPPLRSRRRTIRIMRRAVAASSTAPGFFVTSI